MKTSQRFLGLLLTGAAVLVLRGCSSPQGQRGWSAAQIAAVEGFNVPECAVVDPHAAVAYVSNIETSKEEYWTDDGTGFISRLKSGGQLDVPRWRSGTPQVPLNAPKGMCILNGVLYAADNTRVVRYPLAGDAPGEVITVPGAKRLNDMAAHGDSVYVSDTETGVIHAFDGRSWRRIKGPPGANGITFFRGKMFGVSWDLHEVYELDPAGKDAPRPFALASHFTNLDGIEVLDDGTFIVSDLSGNKVCTIAPDRKTVATLISVESPADIGLDRERNILYVPQFMKNRVVTYQLHKD